MNLEQACRPCRGSCSLIPGRGCFGDLPGDESVVSPPSPIVEPLGAYGRDTRVSDSNGTSLLRFAGDNKLAFVNTFFSVPKGCTSRTFNGTRPADRKRIDYIITRQSHRKLVRNVTVYLQPHADSGYNIVCARADSQGDSLVIENSEPPQGARVLTDEQSRLTPTDANG